MEKEKREEIELHKKISSKYIRIREKNKSSVYYNKIWLDAILDMIPVNYKYKNVLDYGCGTALFYPRIKKRNKKASYTGIDLSKEMLDAARKKHKGIELIEADAEKLPLPKESFDLVIGRGILHHLPNPEKGLKEVGRVLKKKGIVVISDTTTNPILSIFRKIAYKRTGHFSKTHKAFKRKKLLNLFEKNGLRVLKTEGWGYLAFPFAFPDIIKVFRFLPYSIFRTFVFMDNILRKIPLINKLSWHTIVLAEKR